LETTVQVGAEFLVRRAPGRREGAHDELAPERKLGKAIAAQVPKPTLDTMTEDGVPHGAADHETDPRRGARGAGRLGNTSEQVHHQGVAPAALPVA
jgi:hypothetical protein